MPSWLVFVIWLVFGAAAIWEYAILPMREERDRKQGERDRC
jgi:hypothetical protein